MAPREPAEPSVPPMTDDDGSRTSAYWRNCAEDTRARVAKMIDVTAEVRMEAIARMYDQLADRAAKREGERQRQPGAS